MSGRVRVAQRDHSTTDSELIKTRIVDQAKRDGIILLHDIYAGTVPAVPGIIDELRARGSRSSRSLS